MILPDVLQRGLGVVFCGTAVGKASAKSGAYYANPGNKFWQTLAQVGLTPRLYEPSEYTGVAAHGIGLTDLVKAESGADGAVTFSQQDAAELRRRIEEHAPRYLCFNGKRAAKEFFGVRKIDYGLQHDMICRTRIYVAPSTSTAGNRWWDVRWWRTLADLVLGRPS